MSTTNNEKGRCSHAMHKKIACRVHANDKTVHVTVDDRLLTRTNVMASTGQEVVNIAFK